MKLFVKILFCLFWLALGQNIASAQKFAYVDTKYIFDKMPEYNAVEKEIEQLSLQWQKDLEDMQKKIDKMYRDYQAEKVLLTQDVQRQREDAIMKEEQKVVDFKKKKFGYDGELFKQREEKMKPIQDKIFSAIELVAKEKKYNFIFDKSGAVVMLFVDPTFDVSDAVVQKLGSIAGTGVPSAPSKPNQPTPTPQNRPGSGMPNTPK